MGFSVKLDLSTFRTLKRKTKTRLNQGAKSAARKAVIEGRIVAKRSGKYRNRTGTLRRSIKSIFHVDEPGFSLHELVATAPYALFVEGGTRPHPIDAVNVPFLRFKIGNRWISTPHVDHKGSKPYPFMGPGFLKAEAVLRREMEVAVRDVENLWR